MRSITAAVILVVLAGWLITPASAQQANGLAPAPIVLDGRFVIQQTWGDSLLAPVIYDPGEVASVIVRFTHPALAEVRADAAGKTDVLPAAAAAIDDLHARFRDDVRNLEMQASKQGGRGAATFRHAYRFTLNGMAVMATRELLARIADLDYVASVHEDVTVSAAVESSSRVIGADRARAELGATGAGVRIAIIDSGVDYLHVGLGGGFGPGFKVIGGYDFIDDDDDPMDGNGHGTHVAGIAAGDDGNGFLGVAPGAKILAYRVLNDQGSGPVSGVIAAIEHAVDPDGNPATDDGAHVLNLSLGGDGNPDDPASIALDNAMRAGVVSVVAAGNEGRAYRIGSPGTSRLAITVGASDNLDVLADFSSRGPAPVTFENKPDVMAPGVAISSSIPGGVYASYNGTSMSTPHGAGAVALLKQRHPQWTPSIIKSVLMLRAVDMGRHVWQQGAGRIDIMRADAAPVAVVPASLSFGNLDPASTTAQFTRTLTVHNLGTTTRTWAFGQSHAISGTSITFSTPSLTLPGGGSGTVTVTARFTPSQISFPTDIDVPYAGIITASSGGDVMRVPFSVTKTPQLTLQFDEAPYYVAVLSNEGGIASSFNPSNVVSYPLPLGTYDVVMHYAVPQGPVLVPGYIVKEGLAVSGKHELAVARSEARHTITLDPLDRHGQPLSFDYGNLLVERKESETVRSYSSSTFLSSPKLLVSNLSTRFKVEANVQSVSHASGDAYVVPFAVNGIGSSATLQNDPATFRSVKTRYAVPSAVDELFIVPQMYIRRGPLFTGQEYYRADLADEHRLVSPFQRKVHYGARPGVDFGFRYNGHTVYNTTGGVLPNADETSGRMIYGSPLIEMTSSETRSYALFDLDNPIATTATPAHEEQFAAAPVAFIGRMWNIGSISLVRFDQLKRLSLFVGSQGEVIGGQIRHRLSRGNEVILDETTENGRFLSTAAAPGGPHVYDLTFQGGHVDEWPVRVDTRLSFNTLYEGGTYDPDPPIIASVGLLADGAPASALTPSTSGTVVARVLDTYNAGGPVVRAVSGVAMSARRIGETEWFPLPHTRSGDRMAAAWPQEVPPGYYSLRIELSDLGGGRLDYRAAPAFRYGDVSANRPPSLPVAAAPDDGVSIDLEELQAPLAFSWSASSDPDEGQQIRYVFRLWGEHVDTTVTTSDSAVSLDVQDVARPGDQMFWTVGATDGFVVVGGEPRTLSFRDNAVSADDPRGELPSEAVLMTPYPNPSSGFVTLDFALPAPSAVSLEVYDVVGRRVAVVLDEHFPAGHHSTSWNSGELPGGVYFARLAAGNVRSTKQLVVVR